MFFKKLTALLLVFTITLCLFACDPTATTPNDYGNSSTCSALEDDSSIHSSNSENSSSSSQPEDSSSSQPEDSSSSQPEDSSSSQPDDSSSSQPDDSSSSLPDDSSGDVGEQETPPRTDYENMTKAEFYENYTLATSSTDAKKRSEYGLMSGSLETPDQAPEIADNRPMAGDLYIRNNQMLYSENNQAYTVLNLLGEVEFTVYRGGAYITLEEVAAYVYAFGEIPANYTSKKSGSDELFDKWGEYLRLNHSKFSGSTYKYPYEPELPNISGCGGSLQYYEMDIGTTGTDCDANYPSVLYNNGYSITRGAARIVYGKQDLNRNGVFELNEFHLFYTYNHYNDFQEYLNYYGGWGEMFGNITGGGTISSKYDYNPTPYVSVVFSDIFAD